ncbi:MAG: hypothetical protein BKP49_02760 [Treponema sp. CETP13]|nr:MAG: hypothetical protein BKP49_02760 [Treponema sp. CETP13]
MADNFTFKITKGLGIISTNSKGWALELNMVSWNEREPKYDIRTWDPNHEKMGKGITLKKEEVLQLKQILNSLEL